MLTRQDISALDSQNMLGSVEVFHKQCEDAWEATRTLELPDAYKNIANIVLFGMGGSALGMDVMQSLFRDGIPVPIEIINVLTEANDHLFALQL